jgi:DNA-binding transcriptional LysR family regulator
LLNLIMISDTSTMELRQLEQFIAVAELGSFTLAAKRLHVVQSGVSATIQGLERDLGARLLERGSGGVTLTPAGAALLPAARLTLEAARSAREAVTQVATGIAGEVSLGTMSSIDVIDFPALLAQLRQDHPAIRVRLHTSPSGTAGLTTALSRGDLDAALVANDGSGVRGMRLSKILSVPIVALLPSTHALARRAGITLTELAQEQFIDFPVGYGNRRIVDSSFERLGLDRTVAVEVTDVSDAAAYVRCGLGVSLVPAIAFGEAEGVCTVPIHRPALPWVLSLGMSVTRTPSAATRALIELIPRYTHRIDENGRRIPLEIRTTTP